MWFPHIELKICLGSPNNVYIYFHINKHCEGSCEPGLPISILPLRAHFDPKVSAPGYLVSQEFFNMPTQFGEEK